MPKTVTSGGKALKEAKRSKVSVEDSSHHGGPDQCVTVLPTPVGTDPSQQIFPEWSDHEVNGERWDCPRESRTSKKSGSFVSTAHVHPSKKSESYAQGIEEIDDRFFDVHDYNLPQSIPVTAWKRPTDIYPTNTTFVVFHSSPTYTDLLGGSKHLLNSEFMRQFIASVTILEYLGWTNMWPFEGTGANYAPTTIGEPWKGWHHVYSHQKVGKGCIHMPSYNKYGKYIVRLYWMGAWRKIVVDDLIPVNRSNHVLLPNVDVSHNEQEAEQEIRNEPLDKQSQSKLAGRHKKRSVSLPTKSLTIELWPWLLCKALLKVANITWTATEEIVDFDIISCLTGWVLQKVNTTTLTGRDVWDMCSSYSRHFTWVEQRSRPDSRSSRSSRRHSVSSAMSSRSRKDSSKSPKSTHNSAKSRKSTKSRKDVPNPKMLRRMTTSFEETLPFCLVALLDDLREVNVEDVAPCWSHLVLIDQTRNTPLTKPVTMEIQPWKRFRWVKWAVATGILPDERYTKAKCLKLVVPLRLCKDLLTLETSVQTTFAPRQSVRVIEELMQAAMKRMQDPSATAIKPKPQTPEEKKAPIETTNETTKDSPKDTSKEDKKKKKKDKKEIGSKKGDMKTVKPDKASKSSRHDEYVIYPPPENPSFWGEFACLFRYFKALHIYLRPSQFLTAIHITDIDEQIPVKHSNMHEKHVTLSAPQQRIEKRILWPRELIPTRNDALYIFVDSMDYKFLLFNLAHEGNRGFILSQSDDYSLDVSERILANIIVERYNWQKDEIGETIVCLNTYGNRSILIHEPPGRSILRLWIRSLVSYSIIILGDGPIFVDTKEKILELMQFESQALIQTCYNIGASFGKLVGSFGMNNFKHRMQDFYRSYKPTGLITKKESNNLHDVFIQEFAKQVKERVNNSWEIMHAMRVLFLNPSLDLKNTLGKPFNPMNMKQQIIEEARENIKIDIAQSMQDVTSSLEETIELYKIRQMSAVKMQSYFRMLYIKKLKSYHVIEHPKFPKLFEALKKLYRDVFYVDARPDFIGEIMRKVIFDNPRTTHLVSKYDFYPDLQNVINYQSFTGTTRCAKESWVPIGRYVFFIDSPLPELVHICLFSNLTHYVLRVFNNDTNVEMQRVVNSVCTLNYTINSCGYTVLGYGWTPRYQDQVNWKFCFLTLRKRIRSLVIIPNRALLMHEICDYYKPNVHNLICKCLVSVSSDVAATFRLYCSSMTVHLKLQYVDTFNRVCGVVFGCGSIILPVATFKQHAMLRRDASFATIKQRAYFRPHARRKRNSDRASVASGSFTKRSRNASSSSLIPTSTRSNEDFNTLYVVEAYVLDDSWPLTLAEWDMVDEVKKRNLVSHERIPPRLPTKMSRRSSYSDRRPTEPFAPFTSPVWCLQMVYDQSDPITICIDKRREEEIKAIKKRWYSEEPGRYEKSKKLRMKYLNDTYIKRPTISPHARTVSIKPKHSSTGRDPSLFDIKEDEEMDDMTGTSHEQIQRSLIRPMADDKILPPLSYDAYTYSESGSELWSTSSLIGIEEYTRGRVKREEDEQRDASLMINAIENAANIHWKNRNCMGKWLKSRIAENLKMEHWFAELRDETENMMIDAYKLRAKFIDVTLETLRRHNEAVRAAKLAAAAAGAASAASAAGMFSLTDPRDSR